MSVDDPAAEFQRVLTAIAQGRPGFGAADLTRVIDGLEGHVSEDRTAAMRMTAEMMTAYEQRDLAALTAMPARLADLRSRLPEDSPIRDDVAAIVRLATYLATYITRPAGAPFVVPPDIGGSLSAPIREASGLLAAGAPVPAPVVNRLRREAMRRDLPAIDRAYLFAQLGLLNSGRGPGLNWVAIQDFRKAVDHAADGDPQRPQYLLMLADALLNRAEATAQAPGRPARMFTRLSLRPMAGALRDAAEGIALLEQARDLAGWPGQPHWAAVCLRLGLGYRLVGRNDAAREIGTAGLRGHLWQVLMQTHTAAAAAAVKWAAGDALEVAGWHADDGDAEGAAAALEAGRALILHATTETRDVPRRLAEAGLGELARQWGDHPAALEAKPVALRRKVFEKLVEPGRLLDPPTGAGIRAALAAVHADALVYLVPEAVQTGHAVIVPVDGPATILPLPGLTDPPWRTTEAPAGRDLVTHLITDNDEWAWDAVIGPLLDGPFAGREPRLVLVPMGELATVAWHAARSAGTYAIMRATISYAPSARLFCRAAASGAGTSGPVLIVGDPDTGGAAPDLPAARVEAQTVRDRFFPDARYIGRPAAIADGTGSAAEVEAWLAEDAGPGGVLHLACHGGVRDDQAYLLLDGGDQLSADRLANATRTGRRPGLVVLAACRSAVSGRGGDEAFSLAATFLAAGAGAVVAAQWSLPDRATSELMMLFHEHVAAGERPADALRQAQLASLHRPVTDWAGVIHFGR